MTASSGSLDSLLNYVFATSQWSGVSSLVVNALPASVVNGAYAPPVLESVTATATGATFQGYGGPTFRIVGYSDTTNQITIRIGSGIQSFENTYYVLAYTADAIVLGQQSAVTYAGSINPTNFASTTSIIALSAISRNSLITFNASGTFNSLNLACFALGTRIRTANGDVPVEALRDGELVPTLVSGGLSRVRWIGRRTLDVTRHARPWDVAPVRVRAHTFAAGVPIRDLLLSPDHAVMLDGALIPIRYLRNGATIAQEAVAAITYFHVELDAHDVLLAEGLPAESFLDTGNRAAFANAAGPVDLAPDFARRVWAKHACLPLLTEGDAVAAARRRLADRAIALGWGLIDAPALRVEAAGRVLPAICHGGAWYVRLPHDVSEVRLRSRATIPAELVVNGDGRRLGVALADLRLDGAAPSPVAFGAGWHADEGDFRWTDGDASLAVRGSRALCFRLAWHEKYWLPPVGTETVPFRAYLAS